MVNYGVIEEKMCDLCMGEYITYGIGAYNTQAHELITFVSDRFFDKSFKIFHKDNYNSEPKFLKEIKAYVGNVVVDKTNYSKAKIKFSKNICILYQIGVNCFWKKSQAKYTM